MCAWFGTRHLKTCYMKKKKTASAENPHFDWDLHIQLVIPLCTERISVCANKRRSQSPCPVIYSSEWPYRHNLRRGEVLQKYRRFAVKLLRKRRAILLFNYCWHFYWMIPHLVLHRRVQPIHQKSLDNAVIKKMSQYVLLMHVGFILPYLKYIRKSYPFPAVFSLKCNISESNTSVVVRIIIFCNKNNT